MGHIKKIRRGRLILTALAVALTLAWGTANAQSNCDIPGTAGPCDDGGGGDNPGGGDDGGGGDNPGGGDDGGSKDGGDDGGKPGGHLSTVRINREMAFAQIGTLHERVGEQQTWAWDDCGKLCGEYRELVAAGKRPHPFWGRMGADRIQEQGKTRLGYKSQSAFLQLGTDLNVITDDARNHQHLGVMVSFSHGSHDFYDKNQPNKHTGSGSTDMYSVGGYSTWYRTNGSYLDLVGNVSAVRNRYRGSGTDASQNGWGIGLSAEVGRPWRLGQSHWQIEPQAQLTYQYLHLSGFDDGADSVDGQSGGALRARLGTRLAWNADNGQQHTNTFYVTANVVHDLTGNKVRAKSGSSTVTDHYARTWGELGVGGQVALGKATYLFGGVRYSRALGGYSNVVYRGSGLSREAYGGHIGLRHTW